MDLTTDVIFLVVSSANSDLFSYIFATGVGCKIRYIDITGIRIFHILVLELPV